MVKNLLQIIQTAQRELGLPVSETVVGNPDITTQQMFAFSNLELDELRQRPDTGWTVQQFEYNLDVQVATSTTGDVSENSDLITNIPDTSNLQANSFAISGPYIPQAARIAEVVDATTVRMTMIATGTEVGGTIQFGKDTYEIPSDLAWYQNDTWWDRTNFWRLIGPDSPQADQWQRSGIVAFGPRRHWRQLGPYANKFRLWPSPFELSAPLQLVFEYMSYNSVRVQNSPTDFAQYFENDTDTPLLDDRAIIMGIKWRFWEQKGFNWTVKRTEYDNYVDRLIARDGASPTLNLVRQPNPIYISPANIQDGYFPGSSGFPSPGTGY